MQGASDLKQPRKVARALEEAGLEIVDRVSIEVEDSEPAAKYLQTKKEKLGHLLDLRVG